MSASDAPRPGDKPKYLEDVDGPPTVGELRRQQRREAADAVGVPGFGPTTRAQLTGLRRGALLGGLAGVVLFSPLALFAWGGAAPWLRLLVVAVVGLVAGATAGAVYMGGRVPEIERETLDARSALDPDGPVHGSWEQRTTER
ncbi:MAG: hypothetical protein AB7L84_00835 [Acidimicrobiia bacterium]